MRILVDGKGLSIKRGFTLNVTLLYRGGSRLEGCLEYRHENLCFYEPHCAARSPGKMARPPHATAPPPTPPNNLRSQLDFPSGR